MRRTMAGNLIGATALAGMTMVAATPASAGGPCFAGNVNNAPDGRIRVNGGAWQGRNDYPETEVFIAPAVGATGTVEMQWKNKGNDNLTVRVLLAELHRAGRGFKFFVDGVNVSEHLRAGK